MKDETKHSERKDLFFNGGRSAEDVTWRVAGPATKSGGEPPPLQRVGIAGGSRAPRPKWAERLRPSTCALLVGRGPRDRLGRREEKDTHLFEA
jgi:hypothetical protein